MTRLVLIGLTGYAGTGKDTVRALLEEHGMSGFAFADPIRNMVRELLTSNGIDDCWMDRRELKEEIIPQLGVSYRELAQTLGTEWGRSLKGDFWLRIASAYVTDLQGQGAVALVVSDVRFINEAEWVRKQGGVIWRIHRELAGPVREHVSESELDDIKPNITIYNDGSVADLRQTVADAVRELI
jgi:hypothetical protein